MYFAGCNSQKCTNSVAPVRLLFCVYEPDGYMPVRIAFSNLVWQGSCQMSLAFAIFICRIFGMHRGSPTLWPLSRKAKRSNHYPMIKVRGGGLLSVYFHLKFHSIFNSIRVSFHLTLHSIFCSFKKQSVPMWIRTRASAVMPYPSASAWSDGALVCLAQVQKLRFLIVIIILPRRSNLSYNQSTVVFEA